MQQNILDTPIEYLKGVGPQRAAVLKKELQIFTYKDLVNFYPFKYLDRTKYYKIKELTTNLQSEIQLVGKIAKSCTKTLPNYSDNNKCKRRGCDE